MDKFKNDLKNSAENIEIPDSISPEKMREKLNTRNLLEFSKNTEKNSFTRKKTMGILTIAASFILIAAAALYFNQQNITTTVSNTMDAYDDTEIATASTSSSVSNERRDTDSKKIADSSKLSEFYYTTTYDDIKKKVKNVWSESIIMSDEIASAGNAKQAVEESAEMTTEISIDAADTGASRATASYSSTNLQVEGVDEGDIIKTDGKYFYILTGTNQIRIIDVKTLKEICTLSNEIDKNEVYYSEMYVEDNRLILAGNIYNSSLKKQAEDTYYMDESSQTILAIYDLSNSKKPKLVGTIYQDGNYRTSRKIGDYVYLFSDYSYYPNTIQEHYASDAKERSSSENDSIDDTKIIPTVNQTTIPADSIYVSKEISSCSYLVISSVNLKDPSKTLDEKSLMQFGDDFHITKESIYVLQTAWSMNHTKTNIIRFSFQDGKITPVDVASLDGQLTDTFAVNESNSSLRVLLTDWSSNASVQTNSVYVLNDKMKVVGKLQNLAPGETIYSARFMGDIGYFVTYRNTDPLFSVDFSDPEKPQVIGELKITGFSEYLHFYGKDKLFGLGRETDPNTGKFLGIKLSMFDISDPKNVTEEKKLILKGIDECDALDDYKAILVDTEKNLIGFSVEDYKNNVYNYNYLIFSYSEKDGFVKKLDYDFTQASYIYPNNVRGIYINSLFYIVRESEIVSFDMDNDFKKLRKLNLN